MKLQNTWEKCETMARTTQGVRSQTGLPGEFYCYDAMHYYAYYARCREDTNPSEETLTPENEMRGRSLNRLSNSGGSALAG